MTRRSLVPRRLALAASSLAFLAAAFAPLLPDLAAAPQRAKPDTRETIERYDIVIYGGTSAAVTAAASVPIDETARTRLLEGAVPVQLVNE